MFRKIHNHIIAWTSSGQVLQDLVSSQGGVKEWLCGDRWVRDIELQSNL